MSDKVWVVTESDAYDAGCTVVGAFSSSEEAEDLVVMRRESIPGWSLAVYEVHQVVLDKVMDVQ